MTAAHVAESFSQPGFRFEADLAGFTAAQSVLEVAIPAAYVGKPFDPWDVALLRLRPVPRIALTRSTGSAGAAQVTIVGFPKASSGMVVGQGDALLASEEVLLHSADTLVGHSGAPVLAMSGAGAGKVIGVHVGNFNVNPFAASHPRHNVALNLRTEIDAFINQGIGS